MHDQKTLLRMFETMGVLSLFSVAAGLWFQQPVFFYVALVLLFLMLFVKKAAHWVTWLWLKFAHLLGTINTKIILSLIFFIILTPLAFCYRLLHGDFLGIKKKSSSYWQSRDHTYEKTDLDKAW